MPPQWGHFSFVNQAKAPKINFENAACISTTPATNKVDENWATGSPSATPSKGHDLFTPVKTSLSHRRPLADISNSPSSTVTVQSNEAALNSAETNRTAKHVRWAKTPSPLATLPTDAQVASSPATSLASSPVSSAAISAAASLPEFPDIARKITSPSPSAPLASPSALSVHFDSPESTPSHAPSCSPTPATPQSILPLPSPTAALSPVTDTAPASTPSNVNPAITICDDTASSRLQPSRAVKRVQWAATPFLVRSKVISPVASSATSSATSPLASSSASPDQPPSTWSPASPAAVPDVSPAHSLASSTPSATPLASPGVSPATSNVEYNILTSDVIVPPPVMRSDGYLGNGRWAVDHVISHRHIKGSGKWYLLQFSGIDPETRRKYDPKEEPEGNLSKDLLESYRAWVKAKKAAQREARRNKQKNNTPRRAV